MSAAPLAGIKVVEIAGIGPAPCAGMMLADMGAEVIVVDRKSSRVDPANTEATKHMFFNRGKKSIAVNLKSPEGVETVLSLIEQADVLLEGFRPGVMERLGIGPDVCLERNPKLVFGRMTGWGQTGPLSHAAGHDPNYIAVSGALWYGGRDDHRPTAPLTAVGDLGGGTMILVWGVMCALMHAQRTGEGQVVDAAITDGSAYISSLLMMMRNTGQLEDQLGTGWPDGGAPWSETYQCKDGGYITICPLEPQFYQEFLEKLELKDNPTFANQWDKSQWPKGKEELKELFLSKTRDEWSELLEGSDVCFGPVLNFNEAAEHPHNKARNTYLDINGVLQPSPAPKFSKSETSAGVPPAIGGNTDDILKGLGFDETKIAELKEKGAV